jgi:hypothetical protein
MKRRDITELRIKLAAEIHYVQGEIYLVIEGVRLAKRGHSGTPQAGCWIVLEPALQVPDGTACKPIVSHHASASVQAKHFISENRND